MIRTHVSLAHTIACVAVGGAAFIGAVGLSAQQSTTRGLNLGFHLQGASLAVEGGDPDPGGGGGITVGYGFNRTITLLLAIDGATIDAENAPNVSGQWRMAHVDLGVRFHFANSLRRWVPYLQATAGARAVGVDDAIVNGEDAADLNFTGGSFTGGGGLAIYVSEALALDVHVLVSGGEFTSIEVGSISVSGLDIDATSARVGLGLTWWP